jgi:hypothetical protein
MVVSNTQPQGTDEKLPTVECFHSRTANWKVNEQRPKKQQIAKRGYLP